MKRIKYTLMVLLATMAACSEADVDTFVAPYTVDADITASIQSTGDVSKLWIPGDVISIFAEEDGEAVRYKSTLMADSESVAESGFTGELFTNESGIYYALFPHHEFNSSANYEEGTITFRTYQTQDINLDAECVTNGAMPFVAISTDGETYDFEPMLGLFQAKVAGSGTVMSATLTATADDPLWGTITYNVDTKEVTVTNDDEQNAHIVNLYCGEYGIELKDTPIQYFTFALPQTIYGDLTLTLNMEDGNVVSLTPTEITENVENSKLFSYPLKYVYDNTEIEPVNINDIDDTTTRYNTWVVKLTDEADADETLDQDTFSELLEKINSLATTTSVTVLMPDVITILASGSTPSLVSAISAATPMAMSADVGGVASTISLSFPRAATIEEYAFSAWNGVLDGLSLLVPADIKLDDDAFGNFDTTQCALKVDESYYRSLDVPYWRNEEWKSINGERVYTPDEFDASTGKLADGTTPVGYTWVIDLSQTTGLVESNIQTTTLGVKAALANSLGAVTIKVLGSFSGETTDANGKYAFAYMENMATVDLTDDTYTTVPDYFLANSDLVSVTLNPNIESVGMYAFSKCSDLVSVVYGDNEQPVGSGGMLSSNAFVDNSSLGSDGAEVDMSWASYVSTRAFAGCSSLVDLNLSGATTFENKAFDSSNSITNLDLSAAGDFSFTGDDNDNGGAVFQGNSAYSKCNLKLNKDKMDGSASPQIAVVSGFNTWLTLPGAQTGEDPIYWGSIEFIYTHDATDGSGHDGMTVE